VRERSHAAPSELLDDVGRFVLSRSIADPHIGATLGEQQSGRSANAA
jgi:hypothetical protein